MFVIKGMNKVRKIIKKNRARKWRIALDARHYPGTITPFFYRMLFQLLTALPLGLTPSIETD